MKKIIFALLILSTTIAVAQDISKSGNVVGLQGHQLPTFSSNTYPLWNGSAWTAATPGTSGGMTNPMSATGDMISGGTSGTPTRLAGNTTTKNQFLMQQGTGSASAAPVWTTSDTLPHLNSNLPINSGAVYLSNLPTYNTRSYGAYCDVVGFNSGGLINPGSNIFQCTTAVFQPSDVGKYVNIIVANGLTQSKYDTCMKIVSYTNSTTVVLAGHLNASAVAQSGSGCAWQYGHDDSQALQNAVIDAAIHGGGEIVQDGYSFIADSVKTSVTWNGTVYNPNSQIWIPYFSNTDTRRTTIKIRGKIQPQPVPSLSSAGDFGPAFNGSGFISICATYTATAGNLFSAVFGCIYPGGLNFNNNFVQFEKLGIYYPRNCHANTGIPISGIDMAGAVALRVNEVNIGINGSFNQMPQPTNSQCAVHTPLAGTEPDSRVSNTLITGSNFGVIWDEHCYLDQVTVFCSIVGLFINQLSNDILSAGRVEVNWCQYAINANLASSPLNMHIENMNLEQWITTPSGLPSWVKQVYSIGDNNNALYGSMNVHCVQAGTGVNYPGVYTASYVSSTQKAFNFKAVPIMYDHSYQPLTLASTITWNAAMNPNWTLTATGGTATLGGTATTYYNGLISHGVVNMSGTSITQIINLPPGITYWNGTAAVTSITLTGSTNTAYKVDISWTGIGTGYCTYSQISQ